MKPVFVVSVAKHGIISTLMFPIDFFFKWPFFFFSWETVDLPETNYTSEQCRMLHEKLTFRSYNNSHTQQENSPFTVNSILQNICKPHILEVHSASFCRITPKPSIFYHSHYMVLISPWLFTFAHSLGLRAKE